jgi:inositol transporter-like SP family MFS transporter
MRYADQMSRRTLYVVGAAMGVVAWALLSYAGSSVLVLLAFAVIWGVSAGIGAQAFYSVWASELFATRYRATAQGVLFFAARVAVGLLSYVFPAMLAARGVPFVGTLMLLFLVAALVVGAVWAPSTQGKSLDEIERERSERQTV